MRKRTSRANHHSPKPSAKEPTGIRLRSIRGQGTLWPWTSAPSKLAFASRLDAKVQWLIAGGHDGGFRPVVVGTRLRPSGVHGFTKSTRTEPVFYRRVAGRCAPLPRWQNRRSGPVPSPPVPDHPICVRSTTACRNNFGSVPPPDSTARRAMPPVEALSGTLNRSFSECVPTPSAGSLAQTSKYKLGLRSPLRAGRCPLPSPVAGPNQRKPCFDHGKARRRSRN